jgi:phosphoglycerate kinase
MSGLKGIKTIKDFELKDKKVFLRLDLNVPIKNGVIQDETRITAALPTIKYALDHGAKLILSSHLGRPETKEDYKKLSLEPIGKRLAELLDVEVHLIESPDGEGAKGLLPTLRPGQLLLLENLRFEKGETKNATELAVKWASFTDIYINDAFGASHRAHASIHALPNHVKNKGVGFLMEKEITMLDKVLYSYESPFVAVLGGAKVSDKIGVIESLMDKVDVFIIGGAMAYTFLSAQGIGVGSSLVEKDKLKLASDLLGRIEARGKSLLLPKDHLVTTKITDTASARITADTAIDEGWLGVDIGPKTISLYKTAIANAKTVFWNGPMGVFETPEFSKGTFAIAEALANSQCVSIVGGGDSASAVNMSGTADKMTHISTGGGASLEYLQGDALPGLEVLR